MRKLSAALQYTAGKQKCAVEAVLGPRPALPAPAAVYRIRNDTYIKYYVHKSVFEASLRSKAVALLNLHMLASCAYIMLHRHSQIGSV
jgi:hypothetical protein